MLVVATLDDPERRRVSRRGRGRLAQSPEPALAGICRATVIDVGRPHGSATAAAEWLSGAGERELEAGLAVLNRALLAHRVLSADPYVNLISRRQTLVARIGYGAGDEVADGRWREARELAAPQPRWPQTQRRRRRMESAQAGLALALSGRRSLLVSEELALRARLDLDLGREREAALQLTIALDAALTELAREPSAGDRAGQLEQLRAARAEIAPAAAAALTGEISGDQRAEVEQSLLQLERALRARAAAAAS